MNQSQADRNFACGPPTISDYDGDGYPEIGLVDASTYTVYETDDSILWSTTVTADRNLPTAPIRQP